MTVSNLIVGSIDSPNPKIMKTNDKLTREQIDDLNQISNLDEFQFV
jgi:hypothetical protein